MSLAHNIEKGQRTQDVRMSQDITFETMLLTSNTLKGLKNSGFCKPSPIQLHGIPLGKCGFDLLLEAKSGTGKTAVFSIIALEQLHMRKGLQAIVLAPTREIAAQVCNVIAQIGSNIEALKVEVVMGGLSVQDDISKFHKKDVHIVVGSPGRLRHLIQEKHIDVSTVRLIVLDEADKLMEKSFKQDIDYIFSVLPNEKQVIMSSATYSESSKLVIDQYVQNAQHICPDSNSILLGIEQKVTIVKNNSNIVKQTQYRFQELLKILSNKQFKQCLIFCNYQTRVVELHKMLTRKKWPAEQLYGQQEQTDRLDALKTLQEYKCRILVSTDLAARGIDASNVDLVINFEPPIEWQTYLHRIGRAGRFGSYGIAITILSEGKEQDNFNNILNSLNNTLNIKDLWLEEQYINEDLKNSLSSQLSETSHNEPIILNTTNERNEYKIAKYEKLWSLLTTMDDVKEIETFDNLCQSFKKSNHPKCKSLDREEEPQKFSQMKSQIVSVLDCFTFIQDIANENFLIQDNFNNNKLHSDNDDHNKSLSENIKMIKELYKDSNVIDGTNNIVKNIVNANINGDTKPTTDNYNCSDPDKVLKSLKYCKNRALNEYEFEDAVTIEALRNAGLPTAFGQSKTKNIKSKKFRRYTDQSPQKTNDFKEVVAAKYLEKGNQRIKHKTKIESSDTIDTQYFIDSKNNNATCKSKYFSNPSVDEEYVDNNSLSCRNSKHQSEPYNIKANTTHGNVNFLNNHYNYWYKQLKFSSKKVELAVYIDEISKL